MTVKESFLRNSLLEDIDFKKTARENQEEEEDELARLDNETTKTCPKCEQSYGPSQVNHGSCWYYNGYIVDSNQPNVIVKQDQAQIQIQRARLAAVDSAAATNAPRVPIRKLLWTCCLSLVVDHHSCQTGVCGFPDQLKDRQFESEEKMSAEVQNLLENNSFAKRKIEAFGNSQEKRNSIRRITVNQPKSNLSSNGFQIDWWWVAQLIAIRTGWDRVTLSAVFSITMPVVNWRRHLSTN